MGFLATHIMRERNAVEKVPQPDKLAYERSKLLQWLKELHSYLLQVPDFFLLPQVIANTFWWKVLAIILNNGNFVLLEFINGIIALTNKDYSWGNF